MFNRWKKYSPRKQPKEPGWYTCTVMSAKDPNERSTMDLYFDVGYGGRWLDTRRSSVFEGYKVYTLCKWTHEDNRVWEDELCDMTIWVVAWKKREKPWMRGVKSAGKGRKIKEN